MKALSRTLAVLAVVAFTTTAMGQNITNSDHDLRAASTDGGQNLTGLTDICLPCHTPHFSDTSVSSAPLWNHQVTTQTFTMYTTLSGRTGNINGISKLCLSCHDGVTAMDNYGGTTSGSTVMTDPNHVIGTDLTNDHPIGLTYPTTGDYDTVANVNAAGLPLYTVGAEANRVECASCHNPHDNSNTAFLRISNNGSALCLTCHTK